MSTAPKLQPSALDPVKLDPNHYKVEFENDRVRVLRVNYGPRERSVIHSHPDGIGLFLTSQHSRFAFTNGRSTENHFTAGEVYTSRAFGGDGYGPKEMFGGLSGGNTALSAFADLVGIRMRLW